MFKKLFLITLSVSLISCKHMDAIIELRSGTFYIVNTSSTKQFRFTIKETTKINDSTYYYNIQTPSLGPGDERELSKKFTKSDVKYSIVEKEKEVLLTYQIDQIKKEQYEAKKNTKHNQEVKKLGEVLGLEKIAYYDTSINGIKLKYRFITKKFYDTLFVSPINHYEHSYKVTGQAELKGSKN